MKKNSLIDVDVIVACPNSCLNRGEDGLVKSATFNDRERAYASSASQKFAIRHSEVFQNACTELETSIRTARLDAYVLPNLKNVPESFIPYIVTLCDSLGKKAEKKPAIKYDKNTGTYDFSEVSSEKAVKLKFKKGEDKVLDRSTQLLILSNTQIALITSIIQDFIDASNGDVTKFSCFVNKNIFERMNVNGIETTPLDVSLFGSMVASDLAPSVDASMHVADMISTNVLVRESDFFTATDDFVLSQKDMDSASKGSAMLGEKSFCCPCYFKHASIDLNKFRMNIQSCEDVDSVVRKAIPTTIGAFATILPSGTQTTHAAYTLPDFVMITIKSKAIPCNPVNAFAKPIFATKDESQSEKSIKALVREVDTLDKYYDMGVEQRFVICLKDDMPMPKKVTKVCGSLKEMLEEVAAVL